MTDAPTESKTMHLRVPADLHARITDYARATHRSHNGAALALIDAAIRWADRVGPDGKVHDQPYDPTLHTREDAPR